MDNRSGIPPTAEQRVAAFMAAHGREILDMPLSRISDACGVSDATVVRYCVHAGYKGLKDFKIAMARSGAEDTSPAALRGDESLPELKQRLLSGCMEALRMTGMQLSADALGQAVQAIDRSDHLDVYACGGSAPIASYLRHQLIKLGIRASIYSDASSMRLSYAGFTRRDTVMSISVTGETPDVLDALNAARQAGCATICMTAHPESRMARLADTVLIAAGGNFLKDSSYARLSQLAVVDMLFAALHNRKQTEASNHQTDGK